MGSQLTTNGDALRLFFTEDVYLIKGEDGLTSAELSIADIQVVEAVSPVSGVPAATQMPSPVVPAAGAIAEQVVPQAGIAPPVIPVQITPETTSIALKSTDPAIVPVTIPSVQPVLNTPDRPALAFKSLGNNKRNILILVNDGENEVSDEKGRELLRKIVKSINLTANDFALLNYASYPDSSYAQLQQHFSSVLVFAFGVSANQLQLPQHPENSIVMEGAVQLIFSAELRKLEQDPTGKKLLWASLKQLGL